MVLSLNPEAKINHLSPQRGDDSITPVVKMAKVPSKVDSEAGNIFISRSTWRKRGLPKVTQPVNPNLLTLILAHSLLIHGGTEVATADSSSLVSLWLLGYLGKEQEEG